jgi:two-component system, cell cycle sensor histidine kinase and response regulator CckA
MREKPDVGRQPPIVLIVDDEPANRELLEVMLAPEGYILMTATSGEEALAMMEREPPDLVLLDVLMQGMDGYEVLGAIRDRPATKNVPVIIVTALEDRQARLRGLVAGAEDFLTQPIDRAELLARVKNLLRLKAYGDYHDRYSRQLEEEVGTRTQSLIESERLYRSTFDDAPVGIVHVGLDGSWLRVNLRLCSLLGYSREELQSWNPMVLLEAADAPGEREAMCSMAEGATDRHTIPEKRYTRKDGAHVYARVKRSVHRDAAGRALYFITVIEDMTEWRALEAQVRQASKMDAVGQLAAGVAHDFNNLLSVVLSYCDLLIDDLADGHSMRTDLGEIRAAGLRAVDLTRQLLAFSRRQVLQPRVMDLAEIVTGMEKMLRRLIGEDVELVTRSSPGAAKVLVDPGQMEQVVMNLVVNARDALPGGGKIRIEVAEANLEEDFAANHVGVRPGPHVVLTVTDSGTGIDKATQARMFEPFFTTKAVGRGTGLGLATVFGIVRQSDGTIWVESELGKGTTFFLYFPKVTVGSVRPPAPQAAVTPVLGGSETVLLVEDEAPVRALACTILRKYGYNVLEAQGGGDAFLLCEQHEGDIDLLLTDVVMPRMNGRQLAERLAPIRPAMKVLYMSGYTDDEVLRHGINDATIAFIHKPITPEVLARKVRETLEAAGP